MITTIVKNVNFLIFLSRDEGLELPRTFDGEYCHITKTLKLRHDFRFSVNKVGNSVYLQQLCHIHEWNKLKDLRYGINNNLTHFSRY